MFVFSHLLTSIEFFACTNFNWSHLFVLANISNKNLKSLIFFFEIFFFREDSEEFNSLVFFCKQSVVLFLVTGVPVLILCHRSISDKLLFPMHCINWLLKILLESFSGIILSCLQMLCYNSVPSLDFFPSLYLFSFLYQWNL